MAKKLQTIAAAGILLIILAGTFAGCSQGTEGGAAPGNGIQAGIQPGGLGGGEETSEGETVQDAAAPDSADATTPDRSRKDLSQGDDSGCADVALHTIAISPASVSVKEGEQLRSVMITVAGGSGAFKWYTPSLPEGVAFQKGDGENVRTAQITGQALQPGAFTIPVRVRDKLCHRDAQENFALSVAADPGVTPVAGAPAGGNVQIPPVPPRVQLFGQGIDGTAVFLTPTDLSQQNWKPQELFFSGSSDPAVKIMVTDRSADAQVIEPNRYSMLLTECRMMSTLKDPTWALSCFSPQKVNANPPPPQLLVNGMTLSLAQFPYRQPYSVAHKRLVITDQKRQKSYTYDFFLKGRCDTIPLREAFVLFKAALDPNHLEDKGYCNRKNYNTEAGFGLSNAQHPSRSSDSKDTTYMTGGIFPFNKDYSLTSSANGEGNKVADNPKLLRMNPYRPQDHPGSDAFEYGLEEEREGMVERGPQCLEEADKFGVWFNDDGCTGGKPDFFVIATEVKACKDPAKLETKETQGCYFAGWKGRVGWNEVGDYDLKVGDWDFLKDEDGNVWNGHRNLDVAEVFSGLGVAY